MVDVDRMSDREFDERLQAAFRRAGYVVYPVAESSAGADLVLDAPGTRTVLRVRRWDHMVGPSAVGEVLDSRSHYGAQSAIVATTSSFSRDALALAASRSVETWDRGRLIDFLAAQEVGPPRTGLALLGEEVRAGAPSALRGGLVIVVAVLSVSVMAARSRRRRR
jgi:HJR/Mrr/RecB family endonuclease